MGDADPEHAEPGARRAGDRGAPQPGVQPRGGQLADGRDHGQLDRRPGGRRNEADTVAAPSGRVPQDLGHRTAGRHLRTR